jgi:hypothetical protein
MKRILIAVMILLAAALVSRVAAAQQCPGSCSCGAYGTAQGASGPAEYVVCMPPANSYNGDMILFAHGYIAQGSPEPETWLSQLELPDGTALPTLLNGNGFGFAASSFSTDGLAILTGIQDTKALINVIGGLGIPVQKYFVTGASEGGLVAAKSIEEDPGSYAGGLAVCGPVGSFQKQLNYFGDVRVLFDYFFPGVLTSAGGTAIDIPPFLIENWFTVYEPAVIEAVNSNPLATLQLVSAAQIEIGLNPSNAASAIADVLWYNVFATSNAQAALGGNPYDNTKTVYKGSFDDAKLNRLVERYAATGTALNNIATLYETTGLLHDPLVTLHTLADPIVPFWQEPLYAAKVLSQHSIAELVEVPAFAYGHCNVNGAQAETALSVLLLKAAR